MATRLTTNLKVVNPFKLQDDETESFISIEKFQCAQLPQAFNNSAPKIMRKGTIVSQVQVCGSDSNKYHTGRFVIKWEVMTQPLPSGDTTVLIPANGFEPFETQDVLDTLADIIQRVGGGAYPNALEGITFDDIEDNVLSIDYAQACP